MRKRKRFTFQALESRQLFDAGGIYFNDIELATEEILSSPQPVVFADVTGDGAADIVRFSDEGVEVAVATDDGFGKPSLQIHQFGGQQGWDNEGLSRHVLDINDDGKADVVGFGQYGVMVATANEAGDGFDEPSMWSFDFGTNRGWGNQGIQVSLGDVTGDGMLDIVGFGQYGFFVATAKSDGDGFNPISQWRYVEGWGSDDYQRELADVNGDGKVDIIGFGDQGVWVSLAGVEEFSAPQLWLEEFGTEQGWSASRHHRTISDVNGDGLADIVGFGEDGTYVAISNGSGFHSSSMWVDNFGANYGWNQGDFPRFLVDINADGMADIAGFGNSGVYVSTSTGSGFSTPQLQIPAFHRGHGWRGDNTARTVIDVDRDGLADVAGVSPSGVYVASNNLLAGPTPQVLSDTTTYGSVGRAATTSSVVPYVNKRNELVITGSDQDDTVNIVAEGLNSLSLEFNGEKHEFDISDVQLIVFRGGDGHDSFVNDSDIAAKVHGGLGNDSIFSGTGSDWLYGDAGADKIYGRSGDDFIRGGAGNDTLFGEDGDDAVLGDDGDDDLHGGVGSDRVYGGNGNDHIEGHEGVDWLFGMAGNDTIHGGPGSDGIVGGSGGDTIYGEEDADRILADMSGSLANVIPLMSDLEGLAVVPALGSDNLTAYVFGGWDTVYGGDGDDYIRGGPLNDVIHGEAGYDQIVGDSGDDELFGGEGNDKIEGEDGEDLIAGHDGHDVLRGGDGEDTIYGNAGNDELRGDAGNDSIFGGYGNDVIRGGNGIDHIDGGAGDDGIFDHNECLFNVFCGRDDTVIGGPGVDRKNGWLMDEDAIRPIIHRFETVELTDGDARLVWEIECPTECAITLKRNFGEEFTSVAQSGSLRVERGPSQFPDRAYHLAARSGSKEAKRKAYIPSKVDKPSPPPPPPPKIFAVKITSDSWVNPCFVEMIPALNEDDAKKVAKARFVNARSWIVIDINESATACR